MYQITLYHSKSVFTDRRSDVCEMQFEIHVIMIVTCEQALRGTLAGDGKRKESLELHLWNLNICIEKVNAK